METYERYTLYAPDGDMTFVMQDNYVDGEYKSTEVVGFHYGKPDENSIEWYSCKLKAEFCDD